MPVNFAAKSSNTCAVFPEPVSSTKGFPDPPQSRHSRRTPGSTVTNWTRCLDGSCHADSCAHNAGITSSASGKALAQRSRSASIAKPVLLSVCRNVNCARVGRTSDCARNYGLELTNHSHRRPTYRTSMGIANPNPELLKGTLDMLVLKTLTRG